MIHIADSPKNRLFDPFSERFTPIRPTDHGRGSAEGATHFLAQRKRGWPLSTLGTSSKVAIDGPFEAVLGKTRRTEF